MENEATNAPAPAEWPTTNSAPKVTLEPAASQAGPEQVPMPPATPAPVEPEKSAVPPAPVEIPGPFSSSLEGRILLLEGKANFFAERITALEFRGEVIDAFIAAHTTRLDKLEAAPPAAPAVATSPALAAAPSPAAPPATSAHKAECGNVGNVGAAGALGENATKT